jgi:hypothetical protein
MSRIKTGRDNRGNVILILVMATASAALICSALYTMMGRLDVMNRDTSRDQIYQTAETSLLNYTRAAIQRRWCFTASWEQDLTTNCTLAHPLSTERLILSTNEQTHIWQMIAANPTFPHGNPLQLTTIESTVDLSSVTSTHPVKQILATHEFNFVGTVHFRVDRLSSIDLPINGDEVYLKITVDLYPAAGQTLPQHRGQMEAWSKITVYPREIGTFALIIPGDLYIGGSPQTTGDIAFPTGAAGSAGILFDSPVFVNGNINLPSTTAGAYVPVTFSAPIIQGSGIIQSNGVPFTTKVAGGFTDATYANMPNFGGFLGGVRVDGVPDQGLSEFSGKAASNPPTQAIAAANQCINFELLKSDLSQTNGSAMLARSEGANSWDLSWSMNNFFNPQVSPGNMSQAGQFNSVQLNPAAPTDGIMSVSLNFSNGASISSAPLDRTGSLVISPKINSTGSGGSGSTAQPTVTVSIKPFLTNGVSQDNIANLSVNINDPGNNLPTFSLSVKGFETGTSGTTERSPPQLYPTMNVNYTKDGSGNWANNGASGSGWNRADGGSSSGITVNQNWESIKNQCSVPGNQNLAFQPSDWDIEFDMRTSWNVAVSGPGTHLIFSNANQTYSDPKMVGIQATATAGVPFNVYSIASICDIQSNANFVAAFLVCDMIRILPRSTPLRMIGTFITNKLQIDPSAASAGITWSSIYNPNAVQDLRNAGVLAPKHPGDTCNIDPNVPIWSPFKTIAQADDANNCNSISLREKFDNIKWTTVDPDQGYDPNPAGGGVPNQTIRKNHPVRFQIVEFDRGFI